MLYLAYNYLHCGFFDLLLKHATIIDTRGLEMRSREHRLSSLDGSMVGVPYTNSVHMHRPQNVTKIISASKAYLFPWQSVVEITTTVTNRYDELDEVVCELLPDKQTVV